MKKNTLKIIILFFIFFFANKYILAQKPLDTDDDGVSDKDEINIYYTDINNPDTDGDGYSDWLELNTNHSPHNPKKITLDENDQDKDGLSDKMELRFHTNLLNPDTDGDDYSDYLELKNGFDPKTKGNKKLEKLIKIDLEKQKLNYFIGGVKFKTFIISTGKPSMPTPKGVFHIKTKHKKAWSNTYKLWMPYWMEFTHKIGIHELPIWPNGNREGENTLGEKASHGCVRLGIGDAEILYSLVDIGTKIIIN